jgi:hypothetical protein
MSGSMGAFQMAIGFLKFLMIIGKDFRTIGLPFFILLHLRQLFDPELRSAP